MNQKVKYYRPMNFKVLSVLLILSFFLSILHVADSYAEVYVTVDLKEELLRTATFSLDDWQTYPNLWRLTVQTVPETTITMAYIHLEVSSSRFGLIISGNTDMFEIRGTTVKTNTDFAVLYGQQRVKKFEDEVKKTLRLPEDFYTLCFRVMEAKSPTDNRRSVLRGKELGKDCISLDITNPRAPILVTPADGSKVGQFPVFQWQLSNVRTTIDVKKPLLITYTIRVWEEFDTQGNPLSELDALRYAPIWVKSIVNANSAIFNVREAVRDLIRGRKYVWRVRAVDEIRRPVGENDGQSDIFEFEVATLETQRAIAGESIADFLTFLSSFLETKQVQGLDLVGSTVDGVDTDLNTIINLLRTLNITSIKVVP